MTADSDLEYWRWLRQHVGHDLVLLPSADAVILDPTGRVLLIDKGTPDQVRWGLPGGLMELGETAIATVVRETREEAGLLVEPERLTGVYSGPQYRATYPSGDQVQFLNMVFRCRVVSGELRPDGHETLAARYFAPAEMPPLTYHYAEFIRDALADNPRPVIR